MTPLRVGFILPAETVPAWAARLIENTRSQLNVEGVCALLLGQESAPGGLFRLFSRIDRRFFHPNPSPWEPTRLPADLPLLRGDARVHLESLRLDLLINLALTESPPELPALARLGMWTARDGRARIVIGAPVGWRELTFGERLTTCQVEVTRGGASQIAAQAVLATDPQSITRNQMRLLWRAASMLPRALGLLLHRGEADFFAAAPPAAPAVPARSPNLLHLARLVPRQAHYTLRKAWRKRFTSEQWRLMLARRGGNAPLRWEGFSPLVPPPDRLWADPCVIERDGKAYIFVEELLFSERRGAINCLTLDEAGGVAANTRVLEKPHHLSYPFVFEYQGAWYLLPEMSANRNLELYRCTHFPDQWTYEKTLLHDVAALDATLLEHEGRWWLFTNLAEDMGNSTWDSLHLFYADSPLSATWTPHPLNPVVADVRSARPAGRPFRRGGQLFRPSQDSMLRYGHSLRLNRVDKLTVDEYEERTVETLVPPQGSDIIATHTLSVSEHLTVIDVQTRHSRFVTALGY
ncbi:MAG: glucosamine inositolphosphorylceramide transferase family protein [Chloroflexota bacterium]